ncbi:hypothetical protein QTJ16_004687 [Diplocarpon rosae]|uniref:2EXR domain-containing protein n=1 Tax=Diplocarpon rosae TaxID=946125 RepID=A0AAD9SZD1_9HELO|nr:hypothetical protein QTJ16_004687 [Diplocarpon rosae]
MFSPYSRNQDESGDSISISMYSRPGTSHPLSQRTAPPPAIISTGNPSALLAPPAGVPTGANVALAAVAGPVSVPGFDTFHLFSSLPLELRLSITRHAAAAEADDFASPQILEVHVDIAETQDCSHLPAHRCQAGGPDTSFPIISFTTAARTARSALSLLAVTRETRKEMVTYLATLPAGIQALPAGDHAFIYYKPAHTTIYVQNMPFVLERLEEFNLSEEHRSTFNYVKKFASDWEGMMTDAFDILM